MRLIVVSIFLLVSIILSSAFIVSESSSPEDLIIGKWEEVSWEYERINNHYGTFDSEFDEHQQSEIRQNLLVHEAEIWHFEKGGKLSLTNTDQTKRHVQWTAKGRGHILELNYEDAFLEDYHIQDITKDSMVIHFNFDLQVRGIVKLTFAKLQEKNA